MSIETVRRWERLATALFLGDYAKKNTKKLPGNEGNIGLHLFRAGHTTYTELYDHQWQ